MAQVAQWSIRLWAERNGVLWAELFVIGAESLQYFDVQRKRQICKFSVLMCTRKPSCRWQTRATRKHAKIAPIRRAYNVVADNTGLSSFV